MSIGRDDLGHRSETVRRVNLSTILRELHRSGPMSRSDLVTRTGLTRSAIRALIGELAAGDLVIEGPAALDGTPGRPSPVVRPFAEGAAVLALEIAVDSPGRGRGRARRDRPRPPPDRPPPRADRRRRDRQALAGLAADLRA